MNVLMMTNTFTPLAGGVTRSVVSFTDQLRRLGHRVLVVAPVFEHMPRDETDVVRVPAIQHFSGSDFSVVLPVGPFLSSAIDAFQPGLVHAHHPFLLGGTALRVARRRGLPLVFTHHTMYERYTHYVPGDSPALKRFAVTLSTSYANLCDAVVAPSESVAELLRRRGVRRPISVVPTGIDPARLAAGDGRGFRAAHGIAPGAHVVGHLGRLAPEKNLPFLTEAVTRFLERRRDAMFLVAGWGPSEETLAESFAEAGLADRLVLAGPIRPERVADAYAAMDVFAFASLSETQGLVLTEAMAAGVPVVALDAPGAREVVRDGRNGRLLAPESSPEVFAAALGWAAIADPTSLAREARATAARFTLERCAAKLLDIYRALPTGQPSQPPEAYEAWRGAIRMLRAQWELVRTVTSENEGPPRR
ncbi:MAG: glycosyltransferase [Alphaproteobacteria bacterium]|nr:glycosyltransferase [Alphaproteobacteria bacterium]